MPKYQGEDGNAGEAPEIDKSGENFCPHCGSDLEVDTSGKRPPVPPFQLSKFSPKDLGYGALAQDAMGAAGRVAGYIKDASRSQAASE